MLSLKNQSAIEQPAPKPLPEQTEPKRTLRIEELEDRAAPAHGFGLGG
jgi:hypothetical protein